MAQQKHHPMVAGLIAGSISTIICNPYDRALYLAVKNHRPFFHHLNWNMPYAGLLQSLVYRTVNNGLYFPVSDMFQRELKARTDWSTGTRTVAAGMLTGSMSAIFLNWINLIKYTTWGHDYKFWEAAKFLWKKDGWCLFAKGMNQTLIRDLSFGGTYNGVKLVLHRKLEPEDTFERFCCNMGAGIMATVVASPFNYARNVQFAARGKQSDFVTIFRDLRMAKKQADCEWCYVLHHRFNLGWGTVRVGVGMALGNFLYDYLSAIF